MRIWNSAEFRARNDLETLRRADEIKSDSDRLNSAEAIAQAEMDALKKVIGIGRG